MGIVINKELNNEKMKNPFKMSAIADTLVNVGIGGGANVAMDYIFDSIEQLASIAEYKNYIKLGVGVIGGTMVGGKSARYLRPALDGIATVGASEIVSSLINGADNPGSNAPTENGTNGAPFIGRLRMGQKGFREAKGTKGVPFMD